MIKICPQLQQNLETIKTLRSELDLELPKLEVVFKEFKNGNPSTLRLRSELRAERKNLIVKIKIIKTKIEFEINGIEKFVSKKIEVGKEFDLKFEYLGLDKMIEAGKFSYPASGDDIYNSKNFTGIKEKYLLNQEVSVKAKIFSFPKDITRVQLEDELNKRGYRSANLIELLALAKVSPELQKQFPVVACGSVYYWEGYQNVPCLYFNGYERCIQLSEFMNDKSLDDNFIGGLDYYFLATRK
jgi:hypothetical protein